MRFRMVEKDEIVDDHVKEELGDDRVLMYDNLSAQFFSCNLKDIRKFCNDLNLHMDIVDKTFGIK